MSTVLRVILLLNLWLPLAALPAAAADLTIARGSEHSSLDPLFARTGNNYSTSESMFDRLVLEDANNQIRPALALSWRVLDPLTWEIKLRDHVKFHDGGDFTAEDVIFSLERARNVPNSPASFAGALAGISEVRATDRHTLHIKTTKPTPQLIEQIGRIFILSKKAASGLNTADFNAGKGMAGTGPYKFGEWLPGQRLTLRRNAEYWGPKPDFDNVAVRFIPKDAARVAALLAGDVDRIDQA